MFELYRRVVLSHPMLTITTVLLLTVLAGTQIGSTRLDASSDSLLLQGDPDLEYFRETSQHYSSSEFLVLTWQPSGALLSDQSLQPLAAMVDDLRELPGVNRVTSVLDVPLLESPPLSLSDIADSEGLKTLRDQGVDRGLALAELTTSPIYQNLLVGEAGDVTAIEVSLSSDPTLEALLNERESLRKRAHEDALDAEQQARLATVERDYDELQARTAEQRAELVAAVRAVADRYRDRAQIFVGGVPMIAADMISFVRSDLVTFGAAIIGIMVLVLGIIFRDWRWVVGPIANCAATAILMLGLLAWLDWRMTVISSNFVAVLLIVTLSLSVHLVVRYRELEHTEPDRPRAWRAAETARLMAAPCFYTALTTVVAFASLLVAGIQPVIDFGMMMTVGIVVGFLCTFALVPAAMSVFPEPQQSQSSADDAPMTQKFSGYVEHYGGAVLAVTALLLLATLLGISRLKVENRFIDYFKESTEIYQGMELLDAHLGGTIPLDIVLYPPAESAPPVDEQTIPESLPTESAEPVVFDQAFDEDPFADDPFGDDPFGGDAFATEDSVKPAYWFTPQGRKLLDRAHAIVEARPESGKVLSLSTAFEVMDGLYGASLGAIELALVQNSMPEDVDSTLVRPYFNRELGETRISVRAMETSKELRRDQFLTELRSELIEELDIAPERIRFTSLLVLYNNVLQSLFKSQILTIGAVFLVIGLMFWGLFRSFSLAMLALAPNMLAAGMVLGMMGLANIPLDIMTITIAAIVVGIGVDDCIHYIHRFRIEFAKDGDYHAAMHRSHGSIGRAMYYTTVTIMVGFSLLTLSNFTPSLYFGILTDVAMAAAVAGALLLLPKLILIFKPLGPARTGDKQDGMS